MENWKEFNFREDYKHLDNTFQVKLFSGKVVSISNIVGAKLLDTYAVEINTEEIGWIRKKKDLKRFKDLQKFNEIFSKLDSDRDSLDELDWAICSSLDLKFGEKENTEITNCFKTIREYIEKAQQQILTESKTYL